MILNDFHYYPEIFSGCAPGPDTTKNQIHTYKVLLRQGPSKCGFHSIIQKLSRGKALLHA